MTKTKQPAARSNSYPFATSGTDVGAHACGERVEYQGLTGLSLNSEYGKWNKDMLLALDVAYNARNELSAPIVNVFDNDIVRTRRYSWVIWKSFTRSRSDIVKFTREEGIYGCLREIE